jgi:hypothetical protein
VEPEAKVETAVKELLLQEANRVPVAEEAQVAMVVMATA